MSRRRPACSFSNAACGAQLGHVAPIREIAAIVEALYQHLDRDHGAIATLQLQLPGVGLSVLKGRQTSPGSQEDRHRRTMSRYFRAEAFRAGAEAAARAPHLPCCARQPSRSSTQIAASTCAISRLACCAPTAKRSAKRGRAPQRGSGHQHEEPALDGRRRIDPLWIAAHHAQRAVGEENPQGTRRTRR